MSVIPQKLLERLQWYENHITPWTSNATDIGTNAAAMTDLAAKAVAARAAFNNQQAAADAAKTSTMTWHNAMSALSTAGSAIVKNIRSAAETTGNTVYELAQIPSPATPAPVPPPGTPYAFTVELQQDGTLVLKWKCDNPAGASGTVYQVYRKTPTQPDFVFIGASGSRKFIDATIVAGTTGVTYQITAVRSTASGVPAQFTVNFGIGGGGQMTASVVAGGVQPKLAA